MGLLGLVATTYTGLELYAIEEGAGPLAHWESTIEESGLLPQLLATAYADADEHYREHEQEHKGDEGLWEELHAFFANFTLFLVFFHVGGILLSSYVHRENLIKSMFTGLKRE